MQPINTANYYTLPGLKFHVLLDKLYEETIKKITQYYEVTLPQLRAKDRKREIVLARMICMCSLKQEHGWTLKKVGDYFNRDHTTVIHAIQTIKDLSCTDIKIRREAKMFCPSLVLINDRIMHA